VTGHPVASKAAAPPSPVVHLCPACAGPITQRRNFCPTCGHALKSLQSVALDKSSIKRGSYG
jgi:predicted amidophosphoribosyltransferase